MTEHTKRVAAIVYNPIKVDLAALRAAVSAEEEAAGWGETRWFPTRVDDAGQGPTAEALATGVDLVIVAGGDGTVRAVAEALRGRAVPLALLPSGTGNLLARNLGFALGDVAHSLRVAFTGDDRPIDLGMVRLERADGTIDEHAYLVMTGLGLDARMIDATDSDLKKRAGWLAYAKAISVVMRQTNRFAVRFRLDDGHAQSMHANTIMIGNCGLLPANILLLPDAEVDDGLFEMVVLRPKSVLGWAQIMARVFWENGVRRRAALGHQVLGATKEVRAITYQLGSRIVLQLDEPHRVEIDGDGFGMAAGLTAWIEAEGLVVRSS